MDAQASSRPMPEGPLQRDDSAQFKVSLLIAHFETSRQELVNRVSQRDGAVLLFLAAATTIFGVAFGNVTRPAILFAIAPLGLGAAVIYAQHNSLIGQLGYYSGVEVTLQAEEILKKGTWPSSWENSQSLADRELNGEKSRERSLLDRLVQCWRIPKIYRDRLIAISLLIVIPGLAGAVIGTLMISEWWAVVCLLAGVAISLWAGLFLIDSAVHRSDLRDAVTNSGVKTGEGTADSTGGEAKTKTDSPHPSQMDTSGQHANDS
jgi:hypothetical protein